MSDTILIATLDLNRCSPCSSAELREFVCSVSTNRFEIRVKSCEEIRKGQTCIIDIVETPYLFSCFMFRFQNAELMLGILELRSSLPQLLLGLSDLGLRLA
jgi:positive regulator of sigma E activity